MNMIKSLSFQNTVRRILVEQSDEYYKISPKEFEELMKFGEYNGKGVTKLKMFGGKPIWITGDLNLHDTPTDSLGNVKYIDGRLNIANTDINDLSGIVIKGYVWDSGTPIERRRKAEERRKKLQGAEERRFNKEWDINNPDITELGEKANALYKNLVNDELIFEFGEEEFKKLNNLEEEIRRVTNEMEQSEDEERTKQLYNTLSELQDRVEELRGEMITVYNIIPLKYTYYGLQQFEVVGGDAEGKEYAVGDEDEMDKAALEYAENYLSEVGLEGFNSNFIADYLDTDAIENYFRDFYYDDVRSNPEIYFDESEMPTTEEQDRRKEELEEYIEKVEGIIEKFEQKQEDLNDTVEDPNEYKKQWDKIEERIKILKGYIGNSHSEIDNIVPEGEVTTQMVEDKVEDLVSEKMADPRASLDEFGMSIDDYVDMDALARGLVQSDGYGIMGSYDGSYDTENVNGTYYYIMRIS